jgi:hypothetical protein
MIAPTCATTSVRIVGGSAGINLGIVTLGGDAGGEASSVNTSTEAVSQQVSTLNNAVDHHVQTADTQRQIQINTDVTSTAISETETTTTRTLENMNRSRVLNFVFRQLSFYFCRHAEYQAARRDDRAFRDQGSRANDGALANSDVIEDRGPHADQTMRFDFAAMQHHAVTNRDIVVEGQCVLILHHVQDASILDIGVFADSNAVAGFDADAWVAILPKRTSVSIVQKLQRALSTAVDAPFVQERLSKQSMF